MNALQLFMLEHARTHSSAVGGAEGNIFLEDAIFGGLTDEQIRERPGGGLNSLVWLLWHLARTEDLGVNVLDPAHLEQAFDDGTIDARAQWLRGFIGGKTKAFMFGHTVVGHGYMHIGEAMCLRSLIGARLPV